MGIFFYLKSYTDFYEKYGLESYQMEKDQKYMSEEAFREKIAPARTFGFVKDIEMLEKMGLAWK